VSPILESIGSVKGFGWGALAAEGTFESISTTTLSTSTATITFSSIPATYTHLQIRGIARTDRAAAKQDAARIRFNSDTGSNYALHYLLGDGISASAGASTSITSTFSDGFTCAGVASSIFGVAVIDILDYKNTNKYKTMRSLSAWDDNGDGRVWLESGLWQNTSAISTITFTPNAGSNFVQYTQFALYGIKS